MQLNWIAMQLNWIAMQLNWTPITPETLPSDDSQLCLFAQFDDKQSDNFVLASDYMTFGDIKKFRPYELKHYYTHWMAISRPERTNNNSDYKETECCSFCGGFPPNHNTGCFLNIAEF